MIVVSMTIVTSRLVEAPALKSANDRSRWCTAWSLVERNTYEIDEIRLKKGWDTIDIVRHDGHFYSSKPPLLPRLVAELYRVIRFVTGWTLLEQTELVARIILFLINVVPMTVALWLFSQLVRERCSNPFGQLLLIAVACFGTMLLPYLTVFNNHNVAASCFFISLPLALKALDPEIRRNWHFAVCGFITAFGVCNELPSALLGIGFFAILFRAERNLTLRWFVPFALIPIIAFFIANVAATGSWKPFYSKYGTETYEFVHEGVPSYWSDPKGIDKPRDSTLTYLFHCTLGHHGIFSLSPIFLLTLWGWSLPKTYRDERLKWFQILGAVLTLVTLIFFLSRTANYNYSGHTVALRWVLWLIPFWLLAIIPVVEQWGNVVWFRRGAAVLLAVSVFSAWTPSSGPWTQNWIYRWMENLKWIDYSDPRPEFKQTHYTWIGQLPNGPYQPDYWVRYETSTPMGGSRQLELRDAGPGQNPNHRSIQLIQIADGEVTAAAVYWLDAQRFHEGRPVEEFLLGRQDRKPLTEDELTFFRGMPRRIQYVLSRIRYEKTGVRPDAFRTHVCYTNVNSTIGGSRPIRIARDAWLTEEIPFGTLKWEERIVDTESGELLSRRLWLPVAAGKFPPRPEQSSY